MSPQYKTTWYNLNLLFELLQVKDGIIGGIGWGADGGIVTLPFHFVLDSIVDDHTSGDGRGL